MNDERLLWRLRGAPENAYLVGSCGDIKRRHLLEAADHIEALQARVEAAEKASQQLREQIDLVARDMEILEQEIAPQIGQQR